MLNKFLKAVAGHTMDPHRCMLRGLKAAHGLKGPAYGF